MSPKDTRTGLAYGFAAYGMWGLFPLYWPLLEPAGAAEILAHRMMWSLLAVLLLLLVLRRWAWIPALLRQPRRLALVALAATVISVNWGTYIWSVNSGHVVEAALGYFINPLVSIGFGVLLLGERMRRTQWIAVGVGVAAVVVLTVGYGKMPWISLTLAFSFGVYGLVKKHVRLDGVESLAAETAIQFLPAAGYVLFLLLSGQGAFGHQGAGHAVLMSGSGFATALPMVAFGAAAVRLPLTTLGPLQYLAPISQFVLGLAVFHEDMPVERWAGFALVWVALTLLTWDALRTARRGRNELRAAAERASATVATSPAAPVPSPPAAESAAPAGGPGDPPAGAATEGGADRLG